MSCDAIATATSQVDLSSMVKFMDERTLFAFVQAYLKNKYGEVITEGGPNSMSSRFEFYTPELTFMVDRSAYVVRAIGRVPKTPVDLQAAADDLTKAINTAAGAVFQELAAKLIGQAGQIESRQYADNGALVLTVQF